MRWILIFVGVLIAAPVAAQIQSRPTDPPLVTAANESWYQLGEPIQFAGELYYRAGPAGLREADRAYDPVLRGSLITDLAAAARRAGYDATIATLTPESLIALLDHRVPPIVLYQNGRGPLTVRHYAVVTGWNPARGTFTLNDGGSHPRVLRINDLAKRWRTAGSQALIVRRHSP